MRVFWGDLRRKYEIKKTEGRCPLDRLKDHPFADLRNRKRTAWANTFRCRSLKVKKKNS